MRRNEFLVAKENALRKLQEATVAQKVDNAVLPILELLNGFDWCYTMSSCAGRIVLLQIPSLGDKRKARFLGIWHRFVKPPEVLEASNTATTGVIWLLAQAPIFHIGVKSSEIGEILLKTANLSGFKNSAIKSLGRRLVIEICSTERLDAPIGREGRLFCDPEYLELLVEIANEVMSRSKQKLCRLEKKTRGLSTLLSK